MPDTSTTRMLKPQVTKCTKARVQTWYTLSRVYQDFKGGWGQKSSQNVSNRSECLVSLFCKFWTKRKATKFIV